MTVKIKELTIRAVIDSDRSSASGSNHATTQTENTELAKSAYNRLRKQRENRER